jgi:indolepyruvate ferredoxin oxidoreductase beta subunit
LKFLSRVTFSPGGTSACLVVTEIDREKDEYRSCLWLRRNGRLKKLTSFGKERSFQYLDENTILFPGKREEGDKESIESLWYKLPLDGGEAELAYTFPIPVSELLPLPGGDLLLLGQTFPGYEELYTGDKKTLAAYQKARKDGADYEEITQVPWWWNGDTFTKGAYTSLFRYDAKRKKLRRLTAENLNVFNLRLSPDKRSAYFLCSPVKPRLPMSGETALCRLELDSGELTHLAEDRDDFVLIGFEPGETVRQLPFLKKGGAVVVSSRPVMPVSAMIGQSNYDADAMIEYLKAHVECLTIVDADKAAKELGSAKVLNVVLLGAALRSGELGLSEEDLENAVREKVPEKFLELNKKALSWSMEVKNAN